MVSAPRHLIGLPSNCRRTCRRDVFAAEDFASIAPVFVPSGSERLLGCCCRTVELLFEHRVCTSKSRHNLTCPINVIEPSLDGPIRGGLAVIARRLLILSASLITFACLDFFGAFST